MNIKHNLLNRTTRLHVIITNISLHPIIWGGERERSGGRKERKRETEERQRDRKGGGEENLSGSHVSYLLIV